MKRKQPRRLWDDAIEKLEAEGCCRVCKATDYIDAAHIAPRRYDETITGPRRGKTLYVNPLNIVPLCGAFSEYDHHGQFDRNELDLLPYLKEEERAHAVSVLGEGRAMRRITGDRDMLEAAYTGLERLEG